MFDASQLAAFPLDSQKYWRFHARRFQFLLEVVGRVCTRPPATVLDIGMGFQTVLVARRYPQATVNTLGFLDDRYLVPERGGHFPFDLRQVADPLMVAAIPRHDLVIFTEVLEHLPGSPAAMFRALAAWTAPGGILLLQTPNAASLPKRVASLVGRNPFPYPGEVEDFSHHFREYTRAELLDLGRQAGFVSREVKLKSYFHPPALKGQLSERLGPWLPPSLRDGITIAFQRLPA